jgi:hypothetical protein
MWLIKRYGNYNDVLQSDDMYDTLDKVEQIMLSNYTGSIAKIKIMKKLKNEFSVKRPEFEYDDWNKFHRNRKLKSILL